jgi:hypothetical protein
LQRSPWSSVCRSLQARKKPINLVLSHVYNFGTQPVQFAVGGRYYAETAAGAPEWGLRGAVTFLFPTGG